MGKSNRQYNLYSGGQLESIPTPRRKPDAEGEGWKWYAAEYDWLEEYAGKPASAAAPSSPYKPRRATLLARLAWKLRALLARLLAGPLGLRSPSKDFIDGYNRASQARREQEAWSQESQSKGK